MAENNSSAPLKTAEGDATLWCVHVTGADDVHPMPSREVALDEANGLNISFCRIKRQDVDPVLIAVVAEWPHSADSHAAGLMIRDECLRMRGGQVAVAVEAQAAPAAVAVPAKKLASLVEELRMLAAVQEPEYQNFQIVIEEAVKVLESVTPAPPATGDSSPGDLANWLTPVSELLGHISDALPDDEFAKIDTAKWNAVSSLVGSNRTTTAQAAVQADPVAVLKGAPYEPTSAMLIEARRLEPALPFDAIRAIWWAMWRKAPQAEPVADYPHEQMDALALARYKVVQSDQNMYWRNAVVAGDGQQHLYNGSEVDCQNMARKFAGAFLDGAFAFHQRYTAPQAQPANALDAIQNPQEMADWLIAMRSRLGSCREASQAWSEEIGIKSWDNYTVLSAVFAAMAAAQEGGNAAKEA